MPSATPVQIVDAFGGQITTFGGGGSTANPSVTSEKAPTNVATGQQALATSATQIVPARAGRKSLVIIPTSATLFYVGGSSVTSANGLYVAAGASVTLSTEGPVFGVAPSAVTVSFLETY